MEIDEELKFIKRWKQKNLTKEDISRLEKELPSITEYKKFWKYIEEKKLTNEEIENIMGNFYDKQLNKLDKLFRKREIELNMQKLLKK